MTTITENERKVLRAIITNNFRAQDNDSEIWADSVNDASEPSGIEGKALSGVISSLSRKGLVKNQGDGRDALIWLTKEGAAIAS